LGEAVKAFVVPRNSGESGLVESLLEYCREHVPAHLIPSEIAVLNALPKNSAGKTLKDLLRTMPPA
jgi:acyl-coenzyme A synthetase/AMP-(fatty) acid ligase